VGGRRRRRKREADEVLPPRATVQLMMQKLYQRHVLFASMSLAVFSMLLLGYRWRCKYGDSPSFSSSPASARMILLVFARGIA